MQRRIEGGEEPRVRSVAGLLVEVHLVGPRRAHCARHHPHPRQARDPHSMTHNSAPALSPHRRNRRSERHERHRPLHGQGSPSAPAAASAAPGLMAAGVASSDNEEWSLYGAPWLQPVATSGKWRGREDRSNRRKPLLWVATDCLSRMVRRGSPVRVRKRASRKSCTAAFSAARPFACVPQRSVVEHFLEHPGFS